jgi:DNA-binding transcriptional regulator YiaG
MTTTGETATLMAVRSMSTIYDHAAVKRAATIDKHVAQRIKAARAAAGLSQEAVGRYLGVTFQQVQKYENGRNRVSAGKLMMIAELLGHDVQWFFD